MLTKYDRLVQEVIFIRRLKLSPATVNVQSYEFSQNFSTITLITASRRRYRKVEFCRFVLLVGETSE